jgi:hypothetical protein
MNESENQKSILPGLIVLFFIFIFLIYLLYKFGSSNQSVVNPNLSEDNSPVTLDQALTDSEGENEIYFKYIRKIYEQQSSPDGSGVNEILDEYKNELESKVALPDQEAILSNVSSFYDKNQYLEDYEGAYSSLQKAGGGSESKIFSSQIVDEKTLLPLSDYDKETLLRIAVEYDKFAETISNLNTPKVYEKKAMGTIKGSRNLSYLLRQIVSVNDKEVYSLWISKYSTVMFDIIANRYAI